MANRRSFQTSRKRRTTWEGVNIDISNLTVVTPIFITAITEAVLENFPTPTLVRTRGGLTVYADDSSTPGSFGVIGAGLMIVTASAVAAGGVPSPLVDPGNDWFWWDSFSVGSAAADVIGEEVTVHRKVIDSKAMRKVGSNEVVILVTELQTCEGTMVVNLCGAIRFLMKAP